MHAVAPREHAPEQEAEVVLELYDGTPRFRMRVAADGSIELGGEVDFACADAVRSLLVSWMRVLGRPVLDVAALEFVDVAGMRAIALVRSELMASRGSFWIRRASPRFEDLWSMLGYGPLPRIETVATR